MKTNAKRFSLITLFVVFLACLISATGFMIAKATTRTADDLKNSDYYYAAGASVRVQSPIGIRFFVLVEKEVYNQVLTDEDGNLKADVTTGTLIIPTDVLDGEELTLSTATVRDTETSDLWTEHFAEDGSTTDYMQSVGYLYDIPEASYNRDRSWRGYVKIGDEVYYSTTQSRSAAKVMLKAYNTEDTNDLLTAAVNEVMGKTTAISVAKDGTVTALNDVDANMNFIYNASAKYSAVNNFTTTRKGAKLDIVFTTEVKTLDVRVADGLSYTVTTDESGSIAEKVTVTGFENTAPQTAFTKAEIASGGGKFNFNERKLIEGYGFYFTQEYVSSIEGIDESNENYYLHITQTNSVAAEVQFRNYDATLVAGNLYSFQMVVSSNSVMPSNPYLMITNTSNQAVNPDTHWTTDKEGNKYTTSIDGKWRTYKFNFVAPENSYMVKLYWTDGALSDFYVKSVNLIDVSNGYEVTAENGLFTDIKQRINSAEYTTQLEDGTVGNYYHVVSSSEGAGRIQFYDYAGLLKSGYTYTFSIKAHAQSFAKNQAYIMLFDYSGDSSVKTFNPNSDVSVRVMNGGEVEIMATFTLDVDTAWVPAIYYGSGAFDLYITSVTLIGFKETRTDFTFTADNVFATTVNLSNYKLDISANNGLSNHGWVKDSNGIGYMVHTYDQTADGLIRFNGLNQGVLASGSVYTLTVKSTYIAPNTFLTLDEAGSNISVARTDFNGGLYEYAFTFTYGGSDTGIAIFLTQQYEREFTIYTVGIKQAVEDSRTVGSVATASEVESATGWTSDFDNKAEKLTNVGSSAGALEWVAVSSTEWAAHVNLSAYPYRVNLGFMGNIGSNDLYYTLTFKGDLSVWGKVVLMAFNSSGKEIDHFDGQNNGDGTVSFHFTAIEGIDNWAIFSTNQKFEMYIDEINFKAEDFAELGTLDTSVTKVIFPNVNILDDYNFGALSAIVLDKGYVTVLDSGEAASEHNKFALVNTLRTLGVTKIDALILTHPHSDHVGAMTYLIKHFDIGSFYYKDTDYSVKVSNDASMEGYMNAVLSAIENKTNSDNTSAVKVEITSFGQTAELGTVGKFTFYYNQKVYKDENAYDGNYFSLSVMYTSGDTNLVYFGGDLPESTDYEAGQQLDGDTNAVEVAEEVIIWQVNHHGTGGPYGSNALIEKLNPQYAVFAAIESKYSGSYNVEETGRLNNANVPYYYVDGGIEFTLNADGSVSMSR